MQPASGSRASRYAAFVWILALAFSAACDAFERDYDIWVDTLSTGRIRVYNRDLLRSSPEADFVLVEELRLGRAPGQTGGEGPGVFGRVVGLAVDEAGRTYVADEADQGIRVFDPQGHFLRRFGRHGEERGEFRNLRGLAWHPSGVLLAMDIGLRRVTAFDSLGTVLSATGHHEETDNPGSFWRADTDTLGFVYERDLDSPTWAGRVFKHRLLGNLTLAPVDTIALAARGPHFDTIPTNWRPLWSAGPDGSMWHGNTNRFLFLKVSDRNDTTLVVELRRPTPRLEGRARDSLGAAWGLPSNALPRYKAVLTSFHVARDGRIWVWNPHVAQTWGRWEVFDGNGYHLGQAATPVLLATAPSPAFGHGTITGVAEDDAGVQYVVRLRVPGTD
ncbi:MAG: hypothetical protein OXN18_10000 [Gemmatimonadota bacterium]|nr:hypothetical protein [Gemmatimonadota bacterium]